MVLCMYVCMYVCCTSAFSPKPQVYVLYVSTFECIVYWISLVLDLIVICMYASCSALISRKIAILPPDALNSDPPAMTQQRPFNQVLHLMVAAALQYIHTYIHIYTVHACVVHSIKAQYT